MKVLRGLQSVSRFPKIASLAEMRTAIALEGLFIRKLILSTGNKKKDRRHARLQKTGNQRMTMREE